MSSFLYSATEWLSHRLMRKQYVETQLALARRRDPEVHGVFLGVGDVIPVNADGSLGRAKRNGQDAPCVCGDPECELPWRDGGKTQ